MALKLTQWFLDEDDGLGWSEVWYLAGNDFSVALASGRAIANSRAKIMSPEITITYQRVTGNLPADDAPRAHQQRNSALERLGIDGTNNPAGGRNADLPWTCVKIRYNSANLAVFRVQLTRGLPDVFYDQGNDKVAAAQIANWLPGHLGVLVNNGAQIRHLNPIVPPATARVYQYINVASGQYEGYTRRATGRPFGLPRGRRSNRPTA